MATATREGEGVIILVLTCDKLTFIKLICMVSRFLKAAVPVIYYALVT